jgi:hypothetical protein
VEGRSQLYGWFLFVLFIVIYVTNISHSMAPDMGLAHS